MERRLPLSVGSLPPWAVRMLITTLLVVATAAAAADRVVLVVAAKSPIDSLTSRDLHKLYLGLNVPLGEARLIAIRNNADDLLRQVFYQSIVSMSEDVYDRRMLSLTLQQGVSPPLAMATTQQVFDHLARNPAAVSYAWASDVEKDPRVRALRVLWHR